MTAINIVKFRNLAHLAADAAQVAVIPHLPAAVACQGPHGAASLMGARLASAHSFDELLADLPDMQFDAFLMGWSHRRERSEAFRLRPGCPPEPILGTHYVPALADWNPAAALKAAKRDGIRAHMVDAVERQRTVDPSAIGDHCLLVTVARDEVTTRILRRWSMPTARAS
jgi:hypothetical protein